jgi:RNA dependent RNA polymerase
LEDDEYRDEDDICASDKTILTDGCGEISLEKAQAIARKLGLDFIPSSFQVFLYNYFCFTAFQPPFQIRFKGYKGMLVTNKNLPLPSEKACNIQKEHAQV